MTHPSYVSVALSATHDVAGFDCGTPSLDWLTEQALRAQKADTARTYVWVAEKDPERVWGYFSLAPTEVVRAELTGSQASGYARVPAYLLARLAVHTDLKGFGYGGELLVDALTRIGQAAELSGGRLVVVDALDDQAASFYRHYDFTPVRDNPHRLVLKMATVRRLLGG